MKQKTSVWYIGERAEALAIAHLTRRNDVSIRVPKDNKDIGIDMFVDINKRETLAIRTFALQIKATSIPFKKEPKYYTNQKKLVVISKEIPFPICLFFFTMEDDSAYYKWILEPFLNAEGQPKLRPHTSRSLEKLDDAALDHIVAQVNLWYDALLQALAA